MPFSACFGFGCDFFFKDTATTEIYTLSLHDALPISLPLGGEERHALQERRAVLGGGNQTCRRVQRVALVKRDRKSTRLNSSHSSISYAVFCLKKKKLRSRS